MGERRLARKVFLAFSWNPNESFFVRTGKNLVNVFLPLPLMPTGTGKTVLRECTKRLLSSLRRSTDYQEPRRSSEKTEKERGGLLSHWIWRKGGSGEGSEEGLFRPPPPPPPVSLSPSIANKRRSSKVVSSLFLLLLRRRRRNCTSAFAAPLSVPKGSEDLKRRRRTKSTLPTTFLSP